MRDVTLSRIDLWIGWEPEEFLATLLRVHHGTNPALESKRPVAVGCLVIPELADPFRYSITGYPCTTRGTNLPGGPLRS